MTDLSVIILSYNTKEITNRCLTALISNLSANHLDSEIMVIDNASTDGSQQMLQQYQKKLNSVEIKTIFNKKNLGYSKANNQGMKMAKGKHILLLNSDAIVENIDFKRLFAYFEEHQEVGVLTVKVVLPDGKIDPASHRGFPTVWNSFCYFVGFEKILGKIPGLGQIFGGYHLTHLDLNKIHEIDSPSGAFYLARHEVLEEVKGFDDKNFFFYGEDLDLSYRIKEASHKIIYYPEYTVLHLKHASGLNKADNKIRKQAREHFYQAMKIFYRKHYEKKHSIFTNKIVYLVIELKKKLT